MDNVERYGRPQSSTSDLLACMVDWGLLYRDRTRRTFRLTQRAGMLGTLGQSKIVRQGSLVRLLDRIIAQTGLATGLFGMVGVQCQVVTWRKGSAKQSELGGRMMPLTRTAAGWMLLSAVDPVRREGIVRRINADFGGGDIFSTRDTTARLVECSSKGHV